MAASALTARYVERFACIGPACEESCCKGWQIPVDDAHFRSLKKAMSGSRPERIRFREAYRTDLPESVRRGTRALIALQPDGACTFLDEDRLCGVQKRYGEDQLSDTCALYPRAVVQAGARVEMTATLSCPEAARLCLLAPDGMQLCDLPASAVPRGPRASLPVDPADPYDRYLDEVRAVGLHLLAQTAWPLAERLFFLLNFARTVDDFFHRGSITFDERRLGTAIDHLALPPTLPTWSARFRAGDLPAPVAARFLLEILQQRVSGTAATSFHFLVAAALRSCAGDGGSDDRRLRLDVSPAQLLDRVRAAQKKWEPEFSSEIDQSLSNYCRNFWLKEWYVASPNLSLHAQKLILRVALLRALLFAHPALDGAPQRALLHSSTVETVYKMTRAIEHDAGFLKQLNGAIETNGMEALAVVLLSV